MNKIFIATKQIGFITIALTLALAANFTYGQWANPGATPPDGNVEQPINVSGEYQEKQGDLGAVRVLSDQYCDSAGDNCFSPTSVGTTSPLGSVVWGDWRSVLNSRTEVRSTFWGATSRVSNAWYRNTNSTGLMVYVAAEDTREIYVRRSSSATRYRVGSGNGDSRDAPWQDHTFLVPPGYQYRVYSDRIRSWNELVLPF